MVVKDSDKSIRGSEFQRCGKQNENKVIWYVRGASVMSHFYQINQILY